MKKQQPKEIRVNIGCVNVDEFEKNPLKSIDTILRDSQTVGTIKKAEELKNFNEVCEGFKTNLSSIIGAIRTVNEVNRKLNPNNVAIDYCDLESERPGTVGAMNDFLEISRNIELFASRTVSKLMENTGYN